jgi:ribosomal protein S12 methylthiotransferase accessory factor
MKEYFNLRGVCRFKLADYEGAAEDFKHSVTCLDKGSVMDLLNLGICSKAMGRVEDARSSFRAVLALDPGQSTAEQLLQDLDEAPHSDCSEKLPPA